MKSFRFEPSLVVKLSKATEKLGVSETDYVTKVVKKSLALQPLFQNLGGIGVSRILFQRIISQVDVATLEIIGSEVAQNNAPFAFELLGMELDHSSIIQFLKEVLQNLGWFSIEETQDESYIQLKLFHNYDRKWSIFLRSCLLSLFELVDEVPQFAISDRLVKLTTKKNILERSSSQLELLDA
jgi:hypothetical protein